MVEKLCQHVPFFPDAGGLAVDVTYRCNLSYRRGWVELEKSDASARDANRENGAIVDTTADN